MDRGRDRSYRYDDRDTSYGETYRPQGRTGRSPPRSSTYRGNRTPPPSRRGRTPPYENEYQAKPRAGFRDHERPRSRSPRRRSRSPVRRGREDDNYRARARTPPRSYDRPRSPVPRRRQSKSPFNRERSPPRQRRREVTPPSTYRQRSPPPRQGRYNDEREEYDRRNYGPPRDEVRREPRENNLRPRERTKSPRRSAHASGGATPTSSHRSSPQVYPDGPRHAIRSPAYQAMRHEPLPDRRSPAYFGREQSPPPRRAQSPPPRRVYSPPARRPQSPPPRRPQSPPRRALSPLPRSPLGESQGYRDRSPPPRERETFRSNTTPSTWSNAQLSGAGHHGGDSRAPPTGPSRSEYRPPSGPPSGPASSSMTTSGHTRPSSNNFFSAPTRPRGGPSFAREGSYPSSRGGRHFGSPSSQYQSSPTGPPAPRSSASNYDAPSPRFERPSPSFNREAPPFRPNNSSSTTYPRTQRFNSTTNHLASLPTAVEGGKKLPSALAPVDEKRLKFLEEEGRKIREQIEEKQRIKRQGLREWDKIERESKREALKSELAEGHLERLSGEVGGTGGAY